MAPGELSRADLVMGNARDTEMWEMREMQVNHPKGGKLESWFCPLQPAVLDELAKAVLVSSPPSGVGVRELAS